MRYLSLLLVLLAACGSEGAADDDREVSSGFATEAAATSAPSAPAASDEDAPPADDERGDVRPSAGAEREEAAEETAERAVSSTEVEREYHKGPRGGCYTYTESGKKRYVDRSLCK